jgi:hypothetical protein
MNTQQLNRGEWILNQHCALPPDLESILRARMSKIVFRQHRSYPDHPIAGRMSAFANCGHAAALVQGSYVPILLQKSPSGRCEIEI